MVNIEQQEAYQLEINKKIEEHLLTLPEEEKRKFEAVTEACNILTKANVPFYMFPMLTSYITGLQECCQYNNVAELLIEEDGGKLSKKSKKELCWFNSSFSFAVTDLFMKSFLKRDKLFDPKNWEDLFMGLWSACTEYVKEASEKLTK